MSDNLGGSMAIRLPNTFPYQPPSRGALPQLALIYRPPGYVYLAEAVETVGKALYATEWTGKEQLARNVRGCRVELNALEAMAHLNGPAQ